MKVEKEETTQLYLDTQNHHSQVVTKRSATLTSFYELQESHLAIKQV